LGKIYYEGGKMKKLKILPFFLLIVSVILTGCTSTETIKYDKVARPPKPEDYPMEVYTESGVPKEYKVIGEVRVDIPSMAYSKDKMVIKLKSEARKIGADAMINIHKAENTSGGARELWSAKAIVWIDQESY
jgi:hypothetical protein